MGVLAQIRLGHQSVNLTRKVNMNDTTQITAHRRQRLHRCGPHRGKVAAQLIGRLRDDADALDEIGDHACDGADAKRARADRIESRGY